MLRNNKPTVSLEKKAENGNIIGLACGPLKKKRYINPKIEAELVDFKKEIEDKFHKSQVNRDFNFPFIKLLPDPEVRRSSRYRDESGY